jgi:hypothetical protein
VFTKIICHGVSFLLLIVTGGNYDILKNRHDNSAVICSYKKVKSQVTVLSTAHMFENFRLFVVGFEKQETRAVTRCNGQAILKLWRVGAHVVASLLCICTLSEVFDRGNRNASELMWNVPLVLLVWPSQHMPSLWQVSSVVKVRKLYSVVKRQGGNVTRVKFTQEEAVKAQKRSIGVALLFITPALDGGGWSAPRPSRFIPGKETRYPWYRRLCRPQGPPGRVWEISPPPATRVRNRMSTDSPAPICLAATTTRACLGHLPSGVTYVHSVSLFLEWRKWDVQCRWRGGIGRLIKECVPSFNRV